jgi:ribose transport system permease protein
MQSVSEPAVAVGSPLRDPSASLESRIRRSRLLRLLNRYSFSFGLALTVGLLITNLIQNSDFGWSDQLANFAPLAVASMASTPAIIAGRGGLDLSISPVMILTTGLFIVWLAPNGLGGAEAVPILLLAGAGVGVLNGLLIMILRVPAVVVTLAMYFFLIGLNLEVIAAPAYIDDTWVSNLAGHVGPIPGALFTIGAPLVIWALIGLLPYRRMLYAVGSNDATAFSSGVGIGLVRVIAYGLGGLFAAIGGLAVVAVSSTASAGLSSTYALQAIAAVVLGGTSLWGGRGGLIGSVFGAASIYLLGNLLITLNMNPAYLQVMYGGMLLLAVVIVGVAARSGKAAL